MCLLFKNFREENDHPAILPSENWDAYVKSENYLRKAAREIVSAERLRFLECKPHVKRLVILIENVDTSLRDVLKLPSLA